MGKIFYQILNDYQDKYYICYNNKDTGACIPQWSLVTIPERFSKRDNNDNLFIMLHEIGHCETFQENQNRVEKEFYATQWAISHANIYNIQLNSIIRQEWQDYIYSFSKAKDKSKYQLDWSPMERG